MSSYDVRICDWSSDVCSSELGHVDPVAASARVIFKRLPRQGEIALAHAQEPAIGHDCIFDMAAHLVDHEVVDVAQAFAVPAINGSAFHLVRCDQVVGLVPRQVVAIVVGTIALVAAAPALVIPIARAARSEEHTSELQSLMRLSYA